MYIHVAVWYANVHVYVHALGDCLMSRPDDHSRRVMSSGAMFCQQSHVWLCGA